MTKLKPCPWPKCKSTKVKVIDETLWTWNHHVMCLTCGARGLSVKGKEEAGNCGIRLKGQVNDREATKN